MNKLDTMIVEATKGDGNPAMALRVSEVMRFNFGATYSETLERVRKAVPNMTLAKWDALVREGEESV